MSLQYDLYLEEHMEVWNSRRDSYHIWQRDEFAKTFPGWFRP